MVGEPDGVRARGAPGEARAVRHLHLRGEGRGERALRGHGRSVVRRAVADRRARGDRAKRVDPPRAEDRVVPGRAEVVGGALQPVGELRRRESGGGAQHERGDPGDERRGLGRPAECGVALRPGIRARERRRVGRRGAPDRDARGGDANVRVGVAEARVLVAGVGGRDRETLRVRAGVLRRVHRGAARRQHAAVPRGRDHEDAVRERVADRVVEDEDVRVGPERDVDDPGAVIGRPGDALRDVGEQPRAGAVERLHRQHAHPERGARDAGAVVRVGGDDARDVGAVSVVVDLRSGKARRVGRRDERHTRQERAHEVRMARVDPRIDDRDGHRRRAAREIPRLVELRRAQAPLAHAERRVRQVQRVVRREADRPAGVELDRRDRGIAPQAQRGPAAGVARRVARPHRQRDARRAQGHKVEVDDRARAGQRGGARSGRCRAREPDEGARGVARDRRPRSGWGRGGSGRSRSAGRACVGRATEPQTEDGADERSREGPRHPSHLDRYDATVGGGLCPGGVRTAAIWRDR